MENIRTDEPVQLFTLGWSSDAFLVTRRT